VGIGKIIFTLPEEKNAFDIAVKSMDYAIAWGELKRWLRDELKYKELPEDEEHALIRFRAFLLETEADLELPQAE